MPPKPRPRGNRASNTASAAGKDARGLTPMEAAFVDAMLVPGCTAKAAAIKAGYSEASAKSRGAKLAQRPAVRKAIEEGRAKVAARFEITVDRTLAELAAVAYSNLRDVTSWGPDGVLLMSSDGLTLDASAAVAEVSEVLTSKGIRRRVKLHDKTTALGLLMKYQGLAKDQVEHSGPGGAPIQTESTVIVLPSNGRD